MALGIRMIASALALLAVAGAPGSSLAQSDQWNALYDRIIRLEAEVRRLNDEVARLRQRSSGGLDHTKHGAVTGAPRPINRLASQVNGSQYGGAGFEVEPGQPQGTQILGQVAVDQGGGSGVQTNLLPESVETTSLNTDAASGGGAQSLFDSAYSNLLSRRFGLAEAGFKMLVSRHANHKLAGDALYWLGEAYYAQGRYKDAAQSFLNGHRNYPKAGKAPETMYKLALSLNKLGHKKQACSTLSALRAQYPRASKIKSLAAQEQSRAGCRS